MQLRHGAQELKAHYRRTQGGTEKRRAQVIWLLAEGHGRKEVEKLTAYGKTAMVACIKRYNQEGLAGLRDKRHDNPGAEPLLDEAQRQALFRRLQAPPEDGGVWWTSQKVAEVMATQVGQEVHTQWGWEYLMAEIELSALSSQCLDRRIESRQRLEHEVTAWQKSRNEQAVTIDRQFTTQDARVKLGRLYPVVKAQSSG